MTKQKVVCFILWEILLWDKLNLKLKKFILNKNINIKIMIDNYYIFCFILYLRHSSSN